jgi:aspartate carbamoyltransferase regulatory subunit
MAVLNRKETLTELKELGISDPSEINSFIKDYKAYIKIKSFSNSSPKLSCKTSNQISNIDIYFLLTRQFPKLSKSQWCQKEKY